MTEYTVIIWGKFKMEKIIKSSDAMTAKEIALDYLHSGADDIHFEDTDIEIQKDFI